MTSIIAKKSKLLPSSARSVINHDSTNKTDGKPSSAQKKNLTCTVCGAEAIGFNFSVITCMCCKAFFRRNALLGLEPFQCRYSNENCTINVGTRRDCSYCRLKKCFQVGMKKELILTEEMKRIKREKIAANRQILHSLTRRQQVVSSTSDTVDLQPNDVSHLNNLYNAFEYYCRVPILNFEKHEYEILSQQPIKSRMKIQHYIHYNQVHQDSLMSFFKQIPEFRQLNNQEQMALGTHNLLFLIRICLVETSDDQLPLWPSINLLIESIFGQSLIRETHNLVQQVKHQIGDSTCIRLAIIILLFSTFHTYHGQMDTLDLYRIQQKYIELCWLYLTHRYGDIRAVEKFSSLIRHCLHFLTIGHVAEMKKKEISLQNLLDISEIN